MNDTIKPPAGFDAIAVGGPAALLDLPRPPMPPVPRPAPRQTVPLPPLPEPELVAKLPTPPRPVAIAPEPPPILPTPDATAPTADGVEPNPLAGTPAPKPSVFSGLIWDLIRPNRAKVAVLAGVASLAAGAFGLNFLMPEGTNPPREGVQVKIKIPPEEPRPTAPAPTTAAKPTTVEPTTPNLLSVSNPTRESGRPADPLKPNVPVPLPGSESTSDTGRKFNDLPPLSIQDDKVVRASATGTSPAAAPTLPMPSTGRATELPALPGLPPLSASAGAGADTKAGFQPKPPEPNPQPLPLPLPLPTGPAGGSGGGTPATPITLPEIKLEGSNALTANTPGPKMPGLPDHLPPLPDGPGAGAGTSSTLPIPGGPAPTAAPVSLPAPGGAGTPPLPPVSGGFGSGLPTLPSPGDTGLPPLPGAGAADIKPTLPPLPPPPGGNTAPAQPSPGVYPITKPTELKPVETKSNDLKPSELKPLDVRTNEPKPLDTKWPEAKPTFPADTNSFGTPPSLPIMKPMEPVIGASNTTPPAPLPGSLALPPTALQPTVAEAKTDYDVDLHRPRPADTYASVSKVYYGETKYAAALQSFNKGQPIERVAEVQVPPLHVIRKLAPAREPQVERFPAERPIAPVGRSALAEDGPEWGAPGTAGNGQVVYTLFTVPRKGLTLRDVAKTFYASERQWAKLNNPRNPKFDPDEELPVGTQLQVPTEVVPFR